MRSPEAALIRARAKAPLSDLLVLHLSNADIDCIKNLGLCKKLQSLYADSNHVKDLEGIIELRKLWKIDLNNNLLKNLHVLASFKALGFLYLERNRICFEDLVCLRDQHLMELRLLENDGLLKNNTIDEYRKKVVALLPNVWILDSHFISTAERGQAIEEFDAFVASLLKMTSKSAVGKFGSTSDVWVGSEFVAEDDTMNTVSLIDIAHKRANPNEPTDLGRLYAIVSFHNAEGALHNTHCHFAPSRHSSNSRLMPKIWLDEVLALPRRTRIEVIVLLATFLQFRFPKALLSEALAIKQLDSPQFPSEAIRDIANLPPYALVALIAITRHVSLDTEQLMREEHKPEVASSEFEDESKLLKVIPPLVTTLLSTASGFANPVDDSERNATTIRCHRAIKMLSNVASFPDLETVAFKGKGKREAIFRELMPLIRAAESAPDIPGGREVVVPNVGISKHKTAPRSPIIGNGTWKRRPMTQNSVKLQDNIDVAPLSPEGEPKAGQCIVNWNVDGATGCAVKQKPKPGDWVEVYTKQFVKIQFLSGDGQFVVAVLPTDATRSITISLEQLLRVSNSVWRVKYLTKQQAHDLSASSQRRKSDSITTNNTRIGKLHRDSESFHRHGAARNQGFPNHFVTAQMLEQLDSDRNTLLHSSSQTKSIEIFSSNDTLDANYVLTSPEHISAQNYCAVSTFLQQRQVPRGLWSPVQSAQYSVIATQASPMIKPSSLNELKTRKPRAQQKVATEPQPQQPDAWLEIRRAIQLQLGIADTEASTNSSDTALQTDVSAERDSVEVKPMEKPIERSRVKTPQLSTKLSTVRWHQVATKTELIVAAPVLGASQSTPLLQPKLKLVVLPSISQKSK